MGLAQLFNTMAKRKDLIFQVLTKRADKMYHFIDNCILKAL